MKSIILLSLAGVLLTCVGCGHSDKVDLHFSVMPSPSSAAHAFASASLIGASRLLATVGTDSGTQFSFGGVTASLNGVSKFLANGATLNVASDQVANLIFSGLIVGSTAPTDTYSQTSTASAGTPLYGTGFDATGHQSFLMLDMVSVNSGNVTFNVSGTTAEILAGTGTITINPPVNLSASLNVTLTSTQVSPAFAVGGVYTPSDDFGNGGILVFHAQPMGGVSPSSTDLGGGSQLFDASGTITIPLLLTYGQALSFNIVGSDGIAYPYQITVATPACDGTVLANCDDTGSASDVGEDAN